MHFVRNAVRTPEKCGHTVRFYPDVAEDPGIPAISQSDDCLNVTTGPVVRPQSAHESQERCPDA